MEIIIAAGNIIANFKSITAIIKSKGALYLFCLAWLYGYFIVGNATTALYWAAKCVWTIIKRKITG